ncbi:MAG: CocE/NonD family hydrolase [Candidatus Dormibacteria bacterium]
MGDGVLCLANRYAPAGGDRLPIVLIVTPYGQSSQKPYAEIFATRGYQVVVVSCRGRFGSGGEWLPFQTDREDGLATVEWLRRQPWYGGKIGLYGPSYMGFVQWAIAADCPEDVVALALQVTASEPREMIYSGGVFSLRTMLAWTFLVGNQAKGVSDLRIGITRGRALRKAYQRLPLGEADSFATSEHFPFFQDLLKSEDADAPLWKSMDLSDRVGLVTAATHTLTGWYDIFLLGALADHRRLREAGRLPELIIGPWGHSSPGSLGPTLRESLRHFDTHLRGANNSTSAPPVRIYVMGAGTWIDLPEWPPPTEATRRWLHPGGRLRPTKPIDSAPDRYRFDPNDPTPDFGGTSDPKPGSRDNRKLEARPDVLTYTTDPLDEDIEIVGTVSVELFTRSSLPFRDFFCRLCDVDRKGKSTNICDGIIRLTPDNTAPQPDGTCQTVVEMWPTAYRFKAGDRVRLQVSSGSHPRFARNTGTGEPLATTTTLVAADQEVFHGPLHPSALVLPVRKSH